MRRIYTFAEFRPGMWRYHKHVTGRASFVVTDSIVFAEPSTYIVRSTHIQNLFLKQFPDHTIKTVTDPRNVRLFLAVSSAEDFLTQLFLTSISSDK